jgi:ABC-type transporter Mla subunit MlaD
MLQTNADEVTPLLRTLAQSIAEVADQLEAGRDIDELFAQANRARATLEACDPRPPSRSPRS